MTALLMLYAPIRDLNKVNLEVQEGMAAAIRVFELLDTAPEIKEEEGAISLPLSQRGRFSRLTLSMAKKLSSKTSLSM